MGEIMTLLTEDDSKRVADQMIESIISIEHAIKDFLVPKRNKWHSDWLPLKIEDLCDSIKNRI